MTIGLVLTLVAIVAQAPTQTQQTQQTFGAQPRTPPRDVAGEKKGTAVIRGKITNSEGRPLRRVQVRLSGESLPDGRNASTNGLGQYEIRDLPAGRFTLNATRAGYLSVAYGQSRPGEPGRPIELSDAQVLDKTDLVLPHTALISGHILDEAGEPLAGATVLVMQMRFFNGRRRLLPVRGNAITDDTGQFRLSGLEPGEYYVQASSRETWEGDPPERQMLGFLPTFFPSSPNVGEAQRVRVRTGQEAAGTDISLLPGKVGHISGTVFNSQGQPLAGEGVNLGVEIHGENFMSMSSAQSTKVNPDGTFMFRNIAPAEYHLNVRTPATMDRPSEAANLIVSLVGGDVEGLSIVTSAAGGLTGRIVVEGESALPTPLTKLSVRPLPVDRDTAINILGVPDNGRVRDDGTFELKGIVGSNRLGVGPLPEGWAIRRIEQGGRDYTTAPIDGQGQAIDGIMIVLTDRFPLISGVVKDEKGIAVGGTMILFPEDSSLWVEDLRTIRTARPDQSGLFTLRSVRPGDYFGIAVPTVRNNEWNDPEYLESLREHATRISVKEGDKAQIELTIKNPEVR
ncbi:MAG TPA: carboxypeptidase-like regulatory domain-containing protein [Vicinamibacterales bacterium]|nr:carboxypeptidase-like regulatory domain-containing protein [Vicinamibacterales bacterium]